jgi:PAS domain S-box-containing protein
MFMIAVLLREHFYFPAIVTSLVGLCFPVLAVILLLWHENLPPTWTNLSYIHSKNFTLFIIWTAPLVLGCFGLIISRITQQLKKKIDALGHQSTELNTILNTVASAIVTIDKRGIITNFNPAAEQIFGYSRDELIGQNVSQLMPEAIAKAHDGYLQRHLQTGQRHIIGKRREVEARQKDGRVFPAMLRVNPMRIDNEMFFSGVIDDISDTKKLQSQLIQAQKMEAIGQLAAGVAHEINTPIQYIGDNLWALNKSFSDISAYHQALNALLTEEQKWQQDQLAEEYDLEFIMTDGPNAVAQSLEGVERVVEIVKAMKTFSHVDFNQAKQSILLHDAINSALTICRNSYKYVARVETDFSDEVINVECYPTSLNQVLLNLIINSAHAIEESQTDMGLIRISTRKLDDMIDIQIQDNGAGIPKQLQDKVFNLFFTTKPVSKGTGQGLSLAHSIIVDKHQGKLFFESEAGLGTTFHIQLPLNPPSPHPTA